MVTGERRRATDDHDFDTCPAAAEISDCNRERGTIFATLVTLNATLLRLEPLIQAHEAAIQRQVGYQGLIGILSGMVGAVIGFIATRLFKG
jgi:hypothetical protein